MGFCTDVDIFSQTSILSSEDQRLQTNADDPFKGGLEAETFTTEGNTNTAFSPVHSPAHCRATVAGALWEFVVMKKEGGPDLEMKVP